MRFVTTTEIGKKWNLSARRVGVLCSEGRIPGIQKAGNTWLIPEDAIKPDCQTAYGNLIPLLPTLLEASYFSVLKKTKKHMHLLPGELKIRTS